MAEASKQGTMETDTNEMQHNPTFLHAIRRKTKGFIENADMVFQRWKQYLFEKGDLCIRAPMYETNWSRKQNISSESP